MFCSRNNQSIAKRAAPHVRGASGASGVIAPLSQSLTFLLVNDVEGDGGRMASIISERGILTHVSVRRRSCTTKKRGGGE